jgi:hypothetical protein
MEEEGRDNFLKKVGIITLEDIIGNLLETDDPMLHKSKNKNKLLKEQLILLFSEKKEGKELSSIEI